jgi:hypothetical protein
MQHLLLKTSNDIVITDYATMSGFCGKLAVLDRRKVPQVPESFVFLLLVHTSGTDICNKSILNWQLRKKNKKKKHFGEGRRKRRKSKRSETSKQIPATPTLHPPNSPPSISPVRPGRLPTHYPLKEPPAQQKQRALY